MVDGVAGFLVLLLLLLVVQSLLLLLLLLLLILLDSYWFALAGDAVSCIRLLLLLYLLPLSFAATVSGWFWVEVLVLLFGAAEVNDLQLVLLVMVASS